MRKIQLATLVVVIGLCSSISFAVETKNSPAASKARFEAVSANVDSGGDLLVIANLEGIVEEAVGQITELVSASGIEDKRVKKLLMRLPGFLEKNGFYSVQGIGMSAVPSTGGLSRIKVYIGRDPAAANSPLWRGLIGASDVTPVGAGFLPADTVIARVGNGELNELWKIFRSGVADIAGSNAAARLDQKLSNLTTDQGVDLEKVFASLGNEGFVSMQLSTTETFEVPSNEGEPKQMPQPSILFGIAVKDDTIAQALEAPLKRINMPLEKGSCEQFEVSSLNLPLPFPFPIQPSFAICSNYFLMGSSTQVLAKAIASFKSKNGLVASPEFIKAFEGLPVKNNGIGYMSPRFMKVVMDMQPSQNEKVSSAIRSMMLKKGDVQSAFVIQNLKNGVLATGNSSASGKDMMGSMIMAPLGMMLGIAVPSFTKARGTAQRNSCINNLRMIDSAKEQWALAERKADGDEPDLMGMCQYLKGGVLPSCPMGGVYSINAIGEDPACSIPEHEMSFR